jgi:FkbM family methyltransferase
MFDKLKRLGYLHSRSGWSGVLAATRARLTGKQVRIVVRTPEVKAPIYVRVPSSDLSAFDQVFRNGEYDFHASKPKVIIDAGANVGLASLLFAKRYPSARIIAIEPEQSNFDLLKENVAPYSSITPVHAALWYENTTLRIHDPGLGEWGYMTLTSGKGHEVRAVTVDRLMEEFEVDLVDILKIDIEGAEKEVFSNPAAWIDRVDGIIIELHDGMKPGCSRAFFRNTPEFDLEWRRGENLYMSRNGAMAPLK